jgi:hypothetical protein
MRRSAISDLELVARAYAKAIRIEGATDRIAVQGGGKTFPARYPTMDAEQARRRVSDLIVEDEGKGLVWGRPAQD